MKQFYTLFIALLTVFNIANAQFAVWEDDFNDGNADDWTLLDIDNDGYNWHTGGILNNSFQFDNSQYQVLSSYCWDFSTFTPLYDFQNNWAITPEISLEAGGGYYYGGTIKLILDAQNIVGGTDTIEVYGSTAPDYSDVAGGSVEASFTHIGTITLTNPNQSTTDPTQFTDYELDITGFVGSNTTFYIAIVNTGGAGGTYGYEVNTFTIEATESTTLSIPDIENTKPVVQLIQNPVQEVLAFTLNKQFNAATTVVGVYSVAGALVKTAQYNANGMDVSALSSGLYFMEVTDGNVQVKEKFIKK